MASVPEHLDGSSGQPMIWRNKVAKLAKRSMAEADGIDHREEAFSHLAWNESIELSSLESI